MEQQQQQHAASSGGGGACLLPFPDKFHSARSFVECLPYGSELLSDDAWLALGALYSQATKGPCQEPRRWGLASSSASPAEAAWRELGEMPSTEAMRLYVRVLDEEAPGWWRAVGAVGSSGAAGKKDDDGEGGGGKRRDGRAGSENGDEDDDDEDIGRWVSLSTTPDSFPSSSSASASTPCPRYEHAAALLGRALFVVGGSRAGGRMLSDSWALDLETLRWSNLFPPSSGGCGGSLPPRAGLCLLPWKKPGSGRKPACLLAIGGHAPKSGRGGPAPTEMEVWRLEPAALASAAGGGGGRWTLVPTSVAGDGASPPPPRGGHSVTVIPGTSRAFVFGGEVDGDGRGPTSDLFELDLESMTWRGPLRVRGGGGDKKSGAASAAPAPRSGHVAAAVGRFLVIFGGADGDRVFGDVAVLDVDALEWLRPEVEVRENDNDDDESDGGESDGENGDEKRRRRRRQRENQSKRELVVSPRAGASAAVIGKTVFVAGGGDGSDYSSPSTFDAATLALDCSRLPRGPLVWQRAARDDDEEEEEVRGFSSPASSEGLALVALPQVRALLAFGGNTGRLHANLAVLRPRAGVIVDGDDNDEGEENDEEANGGAASDNDDDIVYAQPAAPLSSTATPAATAAVRATAAATAASSPSPSELALMRRQLASAQAAAADAAARAEEAEREAERLRDENERLRRRLAAVLNGDSEGEKNNGGGCGLAETAAPTKEGRETPSRRPSVWAYISGA